MWAEYRLLGAAPGGGNLALGVRILFMKSKLTGSPARQIIYIKVYACRAHASTHAHVHTHFYFA